MYDRFNGKFERYELDEANEVYTGPIPAEMVPNIELFEHLWAMRPQEPQFVVMFGVPTEIPRRQAAFGADYPFSGQVSHARPTPPILAPFRDWSRREIDPRLNGQLLNWYDGPDEYIGKHNDKDDVLFPGSPIVTITLGEERKFRMRPNKGKGYVDIAFPGNTFLLIPYHTNKTWKHEVPPSRRYRGRRISITIRAFTIGVVDPD